MHDCKRRPGALFPQMAIYVAGSLGLASEFQTRLISNWVKSTAGASAACAVRSVGTMNSSFLISQWQSIGFILTPCPGYVHMLWTYCHSPVPIPSMVSVLDLAYVRVLRARDEVYNDVHDEWDNQVVRTPVEVTTAACRCLLSLANSAAPAAAAPSRRTPSKRCRCHPGSLEQREMSCCNRPPATLWSRMMPNAPCAPSYHSTLTIYCTVQSPNRHGASIRDC